MNSLRLYQSLNPIDHPDFVTHKYYLEFLERATYKLEVRYCHTLSSSAVLNKLHFADRVKLAELTCDNLSQECESVKLVPEYARVCCAWIAIKSYYLIFYLETILLALIEDKPEYLRIGHTDLRHKLTEKFKVEELITSSPYFNLVFSNKKISEIQVSAHSNLRYDTPEKERYTALLKKLYDYNRDDFKQLRKIKRLTGVQKSKFDSKEITLLDFFYWYRIKSNYRDLEFIANDNLPTKELVNFYYRYCRVAFNVAKSLENIINDVYKVRCNSTTNLIKLKTIG
ncbi:MAG: hypothetical protein ACXWLH_04590 [Candidatus Saccharimonadales bacterium]